MSIEIKTVRSRGDLRKFVRFPLSLYKNCTNWVPALEGDEYDTFNPQKNEAYNFCETELYLAYKDGVLSGRAAGIINHEANKRWHKDEVRCGWLDFVEDQEVVDALIGAVQEWGRSKGCNVLGAGWGMTDMDKEGILVDGYDKLCSFTCLYNYPYYDTMLKAAGLEKDVDWTQKSVEVPETLPRVFNLVDGISERYGLHVVKVKSMHELCKRYGMKVFHMYNETFAPLHNFSPLTDRQIESYLNTYIPILDKDFCPVCVNADDEPVGFAFCVPTLSRAVKASGGRLFPFGFIRILRALRRNDTIEALMIGVLPEYQKMGVNVLMFKYMHDSCMRRGIKHMVMNPQLEDNLKVQNLFDKFGTEPYTLRRAYRKAI